MNAPDGRAPPAAGVEADALLQPQAPRAERVRAVRAEALPLAQRVREEAHRAGAAAHDAGLPHDGSLWHRRPASERSAEECACVAAYEWGWRSAAARAARGGSAP